ncbi:hypothetical protein WJX72_008090 [[Myrmecia] bisecta]|uniref:ethanolamine-phosphate cytidylyltransferase n=1 Tax=[Myrmecia] bisecta TaxID=41462 RepID=A0AAW1QRQ6_9CHLO
MSTDSEAYRQKLLYWALAAVAVPSVGAAVWWISEKSYNRIAPYEYHYRPGTISNYIANLLQGHAQRRRTRAPIRVYMDGCFDMMHYGHANALRQAKSLGDVLVVGLIPDSEIRRCKGPPVMVESERKILVESVKWVDEVLEGVPYDLTPEFLEELFTKHKIDYVLHGDDPCLLPDGTDAYEHAKKMGRFRMIKRTEGVSSTDIVGRMLMCTRDHAVKSEANKKLAKQFSRGHNKSDEPEDASRDRDASPLRSRQTVLSRFMPTSRRIVQFSDNNTAPPDARIVYIDGAFDLFHCGHIQALELAKAQGDFLLVGLHTDEDVMERRGRHLPIMDLHERSLSVLACKFVDEVIIGAPLEITQDLLTTFNISLVVRGTVSETAADGKVEARRYAVPQAKGAFRTLDSPSAMTTQTVIQRILDNRKQYEARNAKKNKSEQEYYTSKKAYQEEL